MAKPTNLSEAIEQLENSGQSKAQDIKQVLEKDYQEVKKTLEDLKPHLESFKKSVESEVKNAKHQVEEKVKENPWIAIGVVGLIAFVLGWLFGSKHHRDE